MRHSNQALKKHDMDFEESTEHTLKLVPKESIEKPQKEYEVTHNFLASYGIDNDIEREGFFDDLGDFA